VWNERGGAPPAPLPGQVEAALRLVHGRRRRSALLAASTAGAVVLVAFSARAGVLA
jgi:hypothetical protein